MMSLTRGLQSLQKQVDVQTNVEIPSAALTLTRSATLAITTAGTVITWQVETRNQGFTWSGTTITIPTAGYYAVQLALGTTGSQTMAFTRIVNGVTIGGFVGIFSTTNSAPNTRRPQRAPKSSIAPIHTPKRWPNYD